MVDVRESSARPSVTGAGVERGAPANSDLTVYLMTEEEPAWAAAEGLRCVTLQPDSLLHACASDGPSVVVLDAALLRLPDREWVESIEAALGCVIAVGTTSSESAGARESGVRATLPSSFLSVPGELAASVLVGLQRETPTAGEPLERFMRDAIHEFRTPLTVIIEFASLCEDGVGGDLTAKQEGYIGHVLKAADRLCQHFDDYRDAIRMQLGGLPQQDDVRPLDEIVEGAVRDSDANVVVGEMSSAGCIVAPIDAEQLSKAIDRIIAVAAKWTRGDKTIRVSVKASPDVDDAHEVRIEFSGLEPSSNDIDVLAHGTLEFETSLYRSVARVFGLGVAMAKLFLEESRGAVRLEPRPGVGGAYVVTIPTAAVANFARDAA